MKNQFYNYTIEALKKILIDNNFKAYNAEQIYKWVYENNVTDPESMTNISKDLKSFLNDNFSFDLLSLISRQTSKSGTDKFLFELTDKIVIESVLMEHDYGLSLCVTSQAGCSMGCSFCASGLINKQRDLTAAELVTQILSVQAIRKVKITHIVVMGTGEPFDNYDNVMNFVKIINYKHGLQIGSRHITISTCGIVPRIYDFAKEEIKANLAISLHASNNELRSRLMRINRAYPINEVIQAAKDYFDQTKRRVTFEYILLKGINDEIEHANELSDLIRGINCYVNLIPYNPVNEFTFKKTDESRADRFYQQLMRRGINVTLRKEMGSDIDAACGQLRLKNHKQGPKNID
ncbi:MAG: 23S rRNA (adenine(2503)-C(2))-methyltransferase RlmN [Candidatus Izemoplasmatales bacterium]|nr:23S rRNA (adenine(2503)-C(2))-methyltransferase RlmN [Candidatus Izemoplasmatales bacterium]